MGRGQIAAAIRIPAAAASRLRFAFPEASPGIFVHEGARQALERRLRLAFGGPVVLSITDNRHSIVTHRVQHRILHARIHHMFLDAPPDVTDALVRYVTAADREASAVLGDFIEDNGARLARRRRGTALVARGEHHDLRAIFDRLNERYFDGAVGAAIGWGKRAPAASKARRSIKLGSYSSVDRLIRIHPALDRAWVPRYFVAYIVFHEMLHHVIPGSRGVGRVNMHPPAFKAREREFRYFRSALEWERRHIDRLLRG
jgi:hypothetical protein